MRGAAATRACLAATLLGALAALLRPAPAHAHQTSVVYLDVDVRDRVVDVEARIAAEDLGEPLGLAPDAAPDRATARARADRALRYVATRVAVRNGDAACPARPGAAAVRERPGGYALALVVRYTCARRVDALALRYDLFFDLDPRHQGLAQVRAFGATRELIFRHNARAAHIAGRGELGAQLADYAALGVEHIFAGYDHLAFLLGLLLVVGARRLRRGAREAAAIVTAFTAAHSLTLLCAALGWVRLPGRLVESAIALSILWVAADNVLRPWPRGRWPLAFVFGLVHGFGFASVLGELGLPARNFALSVVAFNVGVEAGQLLVVAASLPLLALLRRGRWGGAELAAAAALAALAGVVMVRFGAPPRALVLVGGGAACVLALLRWRHGYVRGVRRGGSVVLGAFATFWLLERVLGREWFGGALG